MDINQVPENKLSANDLGNKRYPLFLAITGSTNNAISNYNALQAHMTKRLTQGFQLNVNYTWSHFLDDLDSSGWGAREGFKNYQNAFNPSANSGSICCLTIYFGSSAHLVILSSTSVRG